MSLLYRPLSRAARPLTDPAPASRRPPWLVYPLVGLAASCLLAGPRELLWPGFLLTAAIWAPRVGLARGWLARPSVADVGWLGLLLGGLVGFAASADPAAAWSRLAALVAALTLFFWVQAWAGTAQRLRWAGWSLVVLCGLGSLAILALINGRLPDSALTRRLAPVLGLFAVFPPISGDVLEVNSRFPVHQYGLAYLLLVIIPFLAATAVLGQRPVQRLAAALLALPLLVLLAATEARGAMLAVAVGIAAVASLRSRWFWGLLPLGALGLYGLLARGIISRSIELEWLQTRLSIWTRALELLVDYPFSGSGLGMSTFARVFAWNYELPNPYQVVHSHNIFIQAYAEQGLLGAVGLLLVLGGSLVCAVRGARSAAPSARPVAAGVLGALIGTVLYGLTDQVPTTNDGLALVAVLAALASAGTRCCPPPAAANRSPSRRDARAPKALPRRLAAALAAHPGLAGAAIIAFLLVGVAPRWISSGALNIAAVQVTRVALDTPRDATARGAELERAEALLGLALRFNPSNIPAYRVLARARLLRHDISGAAFALDQARRAGPLNDYERTQIGRLYYQMGYWQQAFDLWTEARATSLLQQAAEDLAARGESRAAVGARAALVQLEPDVSEHLANLAKAILAAEGKIGADEALEWIERAAALNPEARRSISRQLVLDAETCRINERRGGGRFEMCLFWFGLASRVDPTYDKPEVELGSVYFVRGRYEEAAAHFREALQREPDNGSTWYQLGQTEEAAGRLGAARDAYERAVQLLPTRAAHHLGLAGVYALQGRCAEAQRELAEAQRLNPAQPDLPTVQARVQACS